MTDPMGGHIFGFDVSTSIIGFTLLTDEGKFVRSDHLDLTKTKDMLQKMERVEVWLDSIAAEFKLLPNWIFVEERLGNFSSGRSMLQVLMKLAAFNFAFSWQASKSFGALPFRQGRRLEYLHPSTVKAIMKPHGLIIPKGSKEKKKLTLAFVAKREPTFIVEHTRTGSPKPFMFDMADSYCIALAGYERFVCSPKES